MAIINAGICDVIYVEEYRDEEPIALLKRAGIYVEQMP
jgi:deoxycytidylate deaminase